MKAITTKEFYTWILTITIYIFGLSMFVFEDPDILGYCFSAATFLLCLGVFYKYIQAKKQSSDHKQS